jgi:hypothetical protein
VALTKQFTYVLTGAVNIVVGAASASATIPAGAEFVAIATAGNCHFRMGKGAQTAIAADPMLTTTGGPLVVRVPAGADTIAVIQDGAATGNCNIAMVTEH